MEKILEVKSVDKKYKNGRGVENISFDIYEGEVVGLLGPNGSGKTTIMKAITSLIRVNKGSVVICKNSLDEDFEEAIRNVGCIIEIPALISNMTCYENLKIVSRYYDGIDKSRIDEVLNIVGLSDYKDEKVRNFSLGMKQKLAIAMAIYQSPKLVILDEPANGLDIEASSELRKIILKLAGEFMISFLVSSHLIHEVELICDRILIINNGRIVDSCMVDEIKGKGLTLENYYMEKVNSGRV